MVAPSSGPGAPRRARAAAVLAWTLAGAAVAALIGAAWVSTAAGQSPTEVLGDESGFLAFAIVGAAIVSRRPGNAVGWVMIGAGISFTGTAFANQYAMAATNGGMALPGAVWTAWVASWLWSPGWAFAFGWLPMLFPNGRLLSRRWRPLIWFGVVGSLQVIPAALMPEIVYGLEDDIVFGPNPIGLAGSGPVLEQLVNVAAMLFVPVWLAMLVMQVLRYRRADRTERLQLRWFLWAISVVIGLILLSVLPGVEAALESVPFALLVAAIPVAVGIAVTRYKLYEIDRIISRTVTYAVVLAVMLGIYVTGVLGVGALLRPLSQQNDLTVAVSTLLAAAAFRPALTRVRTAVERRFDRHRYDATEAVASFAQRLRDELDPDQIGADLERVSVRTVQPSSVQVWVAASR